MTEPHLNIVVIAADREHAAVIEAGLCNVGAESLLILHDEVRADAKIAEIDPDVVVIDLERHDQQRFADMLKLSRAVHRPMAMFVDYADQPMIDAAIDAGVSAFIADGLRSERIKPIIDLAISRFKAFERLSQDLGAVRAELADRKRIDQAKGILMRNRDLSEADAYALLRRTAMSQNRKISEVADGLVVAAGLLETS